MNFKMSKPLKKVIFISFFLLPTILKVNAQFIAKNEPKRNEFKDNEKKFKVSISEEETNSLNLRIKVDNPTKEPVIAYLRRKNEFIFLEEKTISSDSKVVLNLNLGLLSDGQYVFVVKNGNGFFLKNINLESGDLLNAQVGNKPVMSIGRIVNLSDD